MSLSQLVDDLLRDTLGTSLAAFRPELAICATIVLILLARLLVPSWKGSSYWLMLVGTAAAFFLTAPWTYLADAAAVTPETLFTGMLVFDGLAVYMRALILGFVLLVVILTRIAGTVGTHETAEFYVLLLGATLGMCLMVSANHMLVVFLGAEMASVPSYALAGFFKGHRQGSEAALKYAVFGAATAGVMLYGISLLCGSLGSAQLPAMAAELAAMLQGDGGAERTMALVLGGLMVAVGLSFKLSAVPFHQWAPDVFEGAAAEVDAFLSVASKAAALALLLRLAVAFTCAGPQASSAAAPGELGGEGSVVRVQGSGLELQDFRAGEGAGGAAGRSATHRAAMPAMPRSSPVFERTAENAFVSTRYSVLSTRYSVLGTKSSVRTFPVPHSSSLIASRSSSLAPRAAGGLDIRPSSLNSQPSARALRSAKSFIAGLIALLAAVTCTFGNLAAYGQSNVKRLMAYSTIAHAGYMLMAVAAAVSLVGTDEAGARQAVTALAFYLGVYLFMNLGVFAGVAFVRNAIATEEIADYAGLVRHSPGLAVCLAILLSSLIGLPPLAGFAAKFLVFAVLFDAGLLGLLLIGAANVVLSLYYYLRVVRVMVLESETPDRPDARIAILSPPGVFCLAMTAPVLVLGIWWDGLLRWAEAAAASLLL